MNKIVVSLGMAAIGASGLQIASAQDSTPPAKFWNVTGSLRGFYDDNINTAPSGPNRQDAFGFEVSPGAALNWETDTTTLRAGYNYSYKYYDHRQVGNSDKYDQVHTFTAALDHAISERFRFSVNDSFVIGQEPDVLAGNQPLATSQYISGNNIRNYGTINFDAQLTRLVGLTLRYDNQFFDYADSFSSAPGGRNVDGSGNIYRASNSGALDRIINAGTVEGNLLLAPETKGLVGFKFQDTDYTADEPIAGNVGSPATETMSDARNSRAYIGYVGVDHSFSPDLSGSIRGGAQYNDYYNISDNGWNPYVQISGKYLYAPRSYAEVGFTQSRTASDVTGAGGDVVRDADTSLVFGAIHHSLTPKIMGSLTGMFQNFTYNGGGSGVDGKSQQYYSLGANVQYRFNPFLSSEIGYNFDNVHTDANGAAGYHRNRVYIGLTASY